MNESKDKTVEIVDYNKVFVDEKGALYLNKKIKTYPFLLVNAYGDNVYAKDPSKVEIVHVTPESLGFTKKETWIIYVTKTDTTELENTTAYYEMPLYFEVPNEARYKCAYFLKVTSGRVSLRWLDSGTDAAVSVNDAEFCKRGKARKLPENTILKRGAPIFTLNANGELELRLDSEAVW
jgi:hypothetical protein